MAKKLKIKFEYQYLIIFCAALLLVILLSWTLGISTTAKFYTPVTCKAGIRDSDGGLHTSLKGTVTWPTGSKTDVCLLNANSTTITDKLIEYYCCAQGESCIFRNRAINCSATADACGAGTGIQRGCKCRNGACVLLSQSYATNTAPTPQVTYRLHVARQGDGAGSISISPSGKTCPGTTDCYSYKKGTQVRLTANAYSGSIFTGWGGDCAYTSTANCTVLMNATKNITATFIRCNDADNNKACCERMGSGTYNWKDLGGQDNCCGDDSGDCPQLPKKYYALLVGGGCDSARNFASFWNDISVMHSLLKWYGTYTGDYSDDDIYILYADGNPPSTANVKNADKLINKDKSYIIDDPFNKDALISTIDELKNKMDATDQLFVYVATHGNSESQGVGLLDQHSICAWNETILDHEFASYINNISSYGNMIFLLTQCFSGGFISELSGPRKTIISSVNCGEVGVGTNEAVANFSFYSTTVFTHYFEEALRNHIVTVDNVPVDLNCDYKTSLLEAFNYAAPRTASKVQEFCPAYCRGSPSAICKEFTNQSACENYAGTCIDANSVTSTESCNYPTKASCEAAASAENCYWATCNWLSVCYSQTPLLDDNADRAGHTAPLPSEGDGATSANIFLADDFYLGYSPKPTTCSDSDSDAWHLDGNNSFMKGTAINVAGESCTDYCDRNVVKECICDRTLCLNYVTIDVICPAGYRCEDGACRN